MELRIEKAKKTDDKYCTIDMGERGGSPYTVHVDNHRILTLFSLSHTITARWVKEVLSCYRKSKQIIVGVSVDRQRGYRFVGYKQKDINYDLITLCVGSQCLMLELTAERRSRGYDHPNIELPLIAFFANPKVVAVGMNMGIVADNLYKDLGMKFSNVMDLNETVDEVMENSHIYDFRRYDLDRLGTTVMGESWVVDRPGYVEWERVWHWRDFSMEKVMYSTYDTYLCFSIAEKLMKMKSQKSGGGLGGKKSDKKKGSIN